MAAHVIGQRHNLSIPHERRNMVTSTRSTPSSTSEARRERRRPAPGRFTPASRRTGPHVNPFGFVGENSVSSDATVSASGVSRQQFRQRCQAVMARDRQRDRHRLLQNSRGSSCNSDGVHASSDGSHSQDLLNSDDLSGTDVEGDSTFSSYEWDEEDEEVVRRVMVMEYRRMLQEQERAGSAELGWLGPDEVAWLEDELRREEQEIEPPPDMEDEDDMLCDIFEHAQSQAQRTSPASANFRREDDVEDPDEDFSWVHDVDLNSIKPSTKAGEPMDTAA